jgi:hypothetical protein
MRRIFGVCRSVWVCSIVLTLLVVLGSTHLQAQVERSTISGTARDSSGAVVVGVKVEARNSGTGVSQSTVTDSEGRYRIPDLPVGNYDLLTSKAGFEDSIHKGITLTVGSQPVVDISLKVGRASEVVTVEGEVSQVETQTAAVSSLVGEKQMRDLPLNGRNFEQLFTLAPGVQIVPQTAAGGGGSATFYGESQNYSVSGSRPVGQAFLLDNEDLVNFFDHAAGSSVTGTSLGIEAIQEFQILTNTYSAEFGGTGAVVNAVSRSGTNTIHGSAYEYLRNSALDARNYFDTTDSPPPFRRNQFGGTLGGPIAKEKLFFFVNYEGLRQSQGFDEIDYVPDANARMGNIPCAVYTYTPPPPPATPMPLPCVNGLVAVGVAPNVAPFLSIYPQPNSPDLLIAGGPSSGQPSGFAGYANEAGQILNENYALARIDYKISSKDSFFGRYISDRANQLIPYPVSLLPNWPESDHSADQYFTMAETRVINPRMVNVARFSITRTNETAATLTTTPPGSDLMQFYPGSGRQDGQIDVLGGGTPIGAAGTVPFFLVQNKFTPADDFSWTRGSHNLQIGVAVGRVQTNVGAPFELGGTFEFDSLQVFLQTGFPSIFLGMSPPSPTFTTARYFREIDFAPYIQDNWKVTPRLTLNLGLRYEYATNAVCAGGVQCNAILNPVTSTGFTPVTHVLGSNPNVKNLDPRIGVAFDPFADHKTSIRAGFGIFHEPVAPRTYAPAFYLAPPSGAELAIVPFPSPTTVIFPIPYTGFAGLDYRTDTSPYVMQYNLTIQRQVAHGTVASIGYVGSSGVHLFSEQDQNPTLPALYPNLAGEGTLANPFTGPSLNPNFGSLNDDVANSHSTYNSLQASLNHQFSRRFVWQASYTYSHCIDDGSVSSGLEQGSYEVTDIFNHPYDRGPCFFNPSQAFYMNGLYSLPFTGNRLVSGWQVSGILSVNSGLPVNPIDGLNPTQANLGGIQGDRPDYSNAPGCHPYQIIDKPIGGLGSPQQWENPGCYTPQPFGTLGNVGRDSVPGPKLVNLDLGALKDTKLTERLNVQFRADIFNIVNHTNFANPNAGVGMFSGTAGTSNIFIAGNAGQIDATDTPSRQIQFALKFIF